MKTLLALIFTVSAYVACAQHVEIKQILVKCDSSAAVIHIVADAATNMVLTLQRSSDCLKWKDLAKIMSPGGEVDCYVEDGRAPHGLSYYRIEAVGDRSKTHTRSYAISCR